MTLRFTMASLTRPFALALFLGGVGLNLVSAQAKDGTNQRASPSCRIEAADYKGWQAQQLSNRWLQLIWAAEHGGRLMQVIFAGHPYLFVNPKYEGKYLPPASGQWFNYGGDKLWLLLEGNNDEQHWAGGSDLLDDGPYSFRKVSEGQQCEIELKGPADPQTGIQFLRTIRLDADSPRINHDFWTFAPVNPASSYLNRYHVRFGPAENPAVSVRDDGLFALRYVYMAAELCLDSTEGWLAINDGGRRYGLGEPFRF